MADDWVTQMAKDNGWKLMESKANNRLYFYGDFDNSGQKQYFISDKFGVKKAYGIL